MKDSKRRQDALAKKERQAEQARVQEAFEQGIVSLLDFIAPLPVWSFSALTFDLAPSTPARLTFSVIRVRCLPVGSADSSACRRLLISLST